MLNILASNLAKYNRIPGWVQDTPTGVCWENAIFSYYPVASLRSATGYHLIIPSGFTEFRAKV